MKTQNLVVDKNISKIKMSFLEMKIGNKMMILKMKLEKNLQIKTLLKKVLLRIRWWPLREVISIKKTSQKKIKYEMLGVYLAVNKLSLINQKALLNQQANKLKVQFSTKNHSKNSQMTNLKIY